MPSSTRRLTVLLVLLGTLALPTRGRALLAPDLAFVTSYHFAAGCCSVFTGVYDTLVSPDDAHVYTASASLDVITALARDATSGHLTRVQDLRGGTGAPPELERLGMLGISPDGKHVYSGGAREFGATFIALFVRDPVTGVLTPSGRWDNGTGGITGLDRTAAVVVSPDGAYVYVAAVDLVVFARDVVTGALTFVETVALDGEGTEMALSANGADLYVAHIDSFVESVSVFDRNGVTGTLTPREEHTDGVAGVSGLAGIKLSPDGAHLYSGTAVFARDGGTGSLTFVAASSPRSIGRLNAMSPDGTLVYGGGGGGVLTMFRDPGTGLLTSGGISGEPTDIFFGWGGTIISSNGRHIYTGGSDRLALLQRVAVTCGATPEPTCRSGLTGASFLQINEGPISPDASKADKVRFKLGKGDETPVAALGDPLVSTDYAVCMYRVGDPARLLDIKIEAGNLCPTRACWKVSGGKATFRDTRRQRSGLKQLKLTSGVGGKVSVDFLIIGHESAQDATPPLSLPVIVQVLNSLGECWEQSFSAPIQNDDFRFKAKQ